MRTVRLISGATFSLGGKIKEATALIEVTTDLVPHEQIAALVRETLDRHEAQPKIPLRTTAEAAKQPKWR